MHINICMSIYVRACTFCSHVESVIIIVHIFLHVYFLLCCYTHVRMYVYIRTYVVCHSHVTYVYVRMCMEVLLYILHPHVLLP